MVFPFSFPDLPKVIAIRVKRRWIKRSTGNGTRPDEPPAIPSILSPALNNPYSQESSTGSSNHAATGSSLHWQRISEMAQIGLPMLHSLVGAVPVAGTALGAAIGGLLSALQLVDVSINHVWAGHAISLMITETEPK